MRLNLDTALVQTPDTGAAAAAGAVRASQAGRYGSTSSTGDSIRISGASSALHQLAGERSARLEALTKTVADGSYQTSAASLGAAIISHAGG